MNKREQVIIILAVLAAVYGVLDYFVFNKKSADDKEVDKIQAAISEADTFATASMARLTLLITKNRGRNLSHTKKLAESNWPRDPFITRTAVEEDQTTAGVEDMPEMIYSGFVKLGNRMLGVINGMEYMVGEIIVDIGYKVRRITPTSVVLLTEANKQVIIYLQED